MLQVALIFISLKLLHSLTNFRCEAKTCLVGKVAIVTGGNSGIGYETVLGLASRGCKVIIGNRTNSEEIVAKIKEETGNRNVVWKYLDLGSFSSVREFASEILRTETRLDILINNGGSAGSKGISKDGLQKVMHVNHFGPFLLTHLLIDLLKKTPKSRVVSVSSIFAFFSLTRSAKLMNAEPSMYLKILDLLFQYGNSKLCVLVAMKVMADRLRKYGIACYSVHPGLSYTSIVSSTLDNSTIESSKYNLYKIVITVMLFFIGKVVDVDALSACREIYVPASVCNVLDTRFRRKEHFFVTPAECAQTILHCALSKEVESLSGKHFWNGKVFWEPPIAYNKEFCSQIWEESEKLVLLRGEEKLL